MVVGFCGDRVDQLAGETDADALDVRREAAEKAVVVAAAPAEARTFRGEGDAGDENEGRAGGVGGRTFFRVGLGDAEGARFQLRWGFHGMKHQVVTHDAGEEDGFRPAPVEGAQIGLAGQDGKGGDSLRRLPVGQ